MSRKTGYFLHYFWASRFLDARHSILEIWNLYNLAKHLLLLFGCVTCHEAINIFGELYWRPDWKHIVEWKLWRDKHVSIYCPGIRPDPQLPQWITQRKMIPGPWIAKMNQIMERQSKTLDNIRINTCLTVHLKGVYGCILSLRCIRWAAGRTWSPRTEHQRRRMEELQMVLHSEVALSLHPLLCGKLRSTEDNWEEWAMNLTHGSTKGRWRGWAAMGEELRNRPTLDGSHTSGAPKRRREENNQVFDHT